MIPHFEVQRTLADGTPSGKPVQCTSEAGVMLQCPHYAKLSDIQHFCMLARSAPNHPVDICLWQADRQGIRRMAWSARLHYRAETKGVFA